MTKVKPAMELVIQKESHSGHEGISKVRPADIGNTMTVIRQSESSYSPQSGNPYSPESHDHQGHHSVSKVRPVSDRPPSMATRLAYYPNEVHQGHIRVDKVQSYHGIPSIPAAPLGDTNSTPHLSNSSPPPGHPVIREEVSSKMASYWGDIPLHGANAKETLEATDGSPRESGKAHLEGSPLVNVDNARQTMHETQPGSNVRSLSVDVTAGRLGPQRILNHGRRSTSHGSRGLGKTNQENKPSHESQTFIPEGLDPRRATQWLCELLKHRKATQPQLTQLPEKMHPRHEKHSHKDSMDSSSKGVLTSVTTFSDKNAADANAINDAMVNLEQLLSEALHIANNVTEPKEHSHTYDSRVDTLHWHACGDKSDTSPPASLHESLLGDLSEDDEHMPGLYTPPLVFIGAVEGLTQTHGCEALPLRSIERKGLLPPGIHRNKITGPHLPHRESSLHLRTTEQRGRSPVLPMPPPDRQLRRNSPCAYVEDQPVGISRPRTKNDVPNSREVREFIRVFHQPPVTSRVSSKSLRKGAKWQEIPYTHKHTPTEFRRMEVDACSLDGGASDDEIEFGTPLPQRNPVEMPDSGRNSPNHLHQNLTNATRASLRRSAANKAHQLRNISLRGRSHVSIQDANFSLTKAHKRQPIARDWSPIRKCYAATVACISTALIGILIGIYAGLVPSIQYFIVDFNHSAILGNVGLYIGMALPTFFCWPLPPVWRLLDEQNPHGELVDDFDCFIGSLGLGFLIGALVINTLQPSWGIYISIILIAAVLVLNVLTPEVRRSVWRRSATEVNVGEHVSRRVARGEIMLHRVKDGPRWWGQEVYHGIALSLEMLRQPGFATMAVYLAWIYAQIVLIIVLLGSLTSRYYRLHSPLVGAAVSSVAIGALMAVPFQKANIFSRARYNPVATNSMTISSNMAWTSHLVRRAIFILVLPIAGAMYAVFSYGPPVPVAVPCLFAALVGFLSCLAIAECNGIIMETWDTSDLEPGMTGRSKSLKNAGKRTNYSSFPRVTAGYAIIHTFGFIFAAGATGVGGIARRSIGQRATTGVVAAILFVLTLLLISVLVRFRHVQIIPDSRTAEMEKWTEARRDSIRRRESAIAAAKASGRKDLEDIPEEDVGWRPLVIGNPLDKNRRMNILELGSLTRWSEIRRKNRLIDKGAHLNRQALEAARDQLGHRGMEVYGDLQRSGAMVGELVRKVSRRSLRSKRSDTSSDDEGGQKHMAGNSGAIGAGLGHSHVSYPTELFRERECVMGQTVEEEGEEPPLIEEPPPQDAWIGSRSRDRKLHQMPTVQPPAGFEQQEVRGGTHYMSADHVSDIEGGRREHSSHMAPKVQHAVPDGTRHGVAYALAENTGLIWRVRSGKPVTGKAGGVGEMATAVVSQAHKDKVERQAQ
ncbi:hypothetical protein PG999_006245 [Apiospora kogelbergensis]|uniref:Polyamine transport protein n=1 Tax=Apiospora kogelbergensis TaxID=1337665 RepID=A0AAW0QRL9_9PEZI